VGREDFAAIIGADGRRLLQTVDAATDLPCLREVPAVQTLRQVWAQQYTDPPGPLHWRTVQERAPSAEVIAFPYDPDARYSTKRGIPWVGYKVHLTETCDNGQPAVITQVMATPATTPDCVIGPAIHQDLAARGVLPGLHLLDGGDVDAELLVTAQAQHQIDVVGPPFGSYSHRRRASQGDDLSAFVIDWEAQHARCPQGQTSIRLTPGRDVSGDSVVRIRFHAATCRACPVCQACTRAKAAPRQLTVRPQVFHEAIQAARQRQETAEFTAQYAPAGWD
jgi:transposase